GSPRSPTLARSAMTLACLRTTGTLSSEKLQHSAALHAHHSLAPGNLREASFASVAPCILVNLGTDGASSFQHRREHVSASPYMGVEHQVSRTAVVPHDLPHHAQRFPSAPRAPLVSGST